MSAERSALGRASASIVTVAQALHWFDRPAFYAEVRRVVMARGVVAVWSYGLPTLHDPTLDEIVRRFHGETVGPYWPAERRLVDEGYRSLTLPFERVEPPPFSMQADWTLDHLGGYLSTWSAVQRARVATGSAARGRDTARRVGGRAERTSRGMATDPPRRSGLTALRTASVVILDTRVRLVGLPTNRPKSWRPPTILSGKLHDRSRFARRCREGRRRAVTEPVGQGDRKRSIERELSGSVTASVAG
jgi:hypothetical protein